jgi:hypothetical protein
MRDVIGCNGSQASARAWKRSNYRLWVCFDVSHAELLIRVTEFVPDLTVGHRDDSSTFEFLQ